MHAHAGSSERCLTGNKSILFAFYSRRAQLGATAHFRSPGSWPPKIQWLMCVAGVVEVAAQRMGWSAAPCDWEWTCWRDYGWKMVIGWGIMGSTGRGCWKHGSVPFRALCSVRVTTQIDAAATLLNDLSVFQKFINLLDLWSHWALCVGNRISVQYLDVALCFEGGRSKGWCSR